MVFTTPTYINQIPCDPPSSIPVHDFLFKQGSQYGRHPQEKSLNPFTCGLTGRTYTTSEYVNRYEALARALSSELGLKVNEGTEYDKIIGTFSVNTIDTMAISWATHRLSGASCQISQAYQVPELVRQLEKVKCKAIFTCAPLLDIALEAAEKTGLPRKHIYIIDVAEKTKKGATVPSDLKTVDQLVEEGSTMEELEELEWTEGQGIRQTAYLCSSSGTSGMPKQVMISHRNVIMNVLQAAAFDSDHKKSPDMGLGVLPLSHSYGLILSGHMCAYRGDGLVVMPGFDLMDTLNVIQDYKIARTWFVPPMIVAMVKAAAITKQFDLSSVKHLVVGALPITEKILMDFKELLPECKVVRVYGLTETAVVLTFGHPEDLMAGSVGFLLPGHEARLVTLDGDEVTTYDTPGQLLIRSKTVMLGYLDNKEATDETIGMDGWLRTGDLAEFRQSDKGNDHLFIVDRVKEMIKVRGLQVAPTELETYLIRNTLVADVAVVPIPNDSAGELPLAFIVKSESAKEKDEKEVKQAIEDAVATNFAEYKRLAGGVEFLDKLPKSASGKTLRGIMKQKARDIHEASQARAPAVIQSFDFSDSEDDSDDDDE